jgi:dihydrofolate reductase
MRQLKVFNQVTLDGFIADVNGDMSWAHKQDPEWQAWVESNARGTSELLFGRITYQQMASWWPTPMALQVMPAVAERMNSAPKVVFSRSLERAEWSNTRIVNGELGAEVQKLKEEPGPDMVLMGSASVVRQLALLDLIDSLQLVLNPLILGAGKPLFGGVKQPLGLKLLETRRFENGNVVVSYQREHGEREES